ncbi:isoaspartyl peptidase/L-asparaginase [Salmonella enterica subsp. enterica serovar Enteritidis]|uniref:isoaspartyl peptidase/L-asparaginase family protein n=1 Tax=Salmonella enterica TaxID=28901 RepID=UPI0014189F7F|nr:isoaspartyl peptidase/L-asparaginase [Salmonella enterica subsp. enterica serovar Muenchen]ECK2142799.1 isoaspartyl peptidase/L-asparaginase [Salmonella enterica subsp. enterica serovar Enteritidis]EDW2055598.1 isoaspartyl peptidase/L-asparaginase [Salmonella enterica subsp. enterica]EGY8942360.1 isoaspartyl peptidase/L-asparaginase [Salmonella enterica subsp. diarizonae serovar 60:r:z]EHC0798127.1 isoaspartyl peptidase/L-asparaginase [Salmonella enterica]
MSKTVLLIHGGAGNTINHLSEQELNERRAILITSLKAGQQILLNGGSAVDAVTAAVVVMEDSPLFNAGKGAVFTHDGKNEMDACIMDGRNLAVGAVGGVTHIKNPVKAARVIMENSIHALLVGEGAEAFVKGYGIELVEPDYFFTTFRYEQLQEALKQDKLMLDHDADSKKQPGYMGTVGAVALDMQGDLAAATSTGGVTNKKYGRVGDTALAGAGNYANNQSVACSATGTGDRFIQAVACHDVSAVYEYKGLTVEASVHEVLGKIYALSGHGGIIAVDRQGDYAFDMNASGMYRGIAEDDHEPRVAMFKDDPL